MRHGGCYWSNCERTTGLRVPMGPGKNANPSGGKTEAYVLTSAAVTTAWNHLAMSEIKCARPGALE